MFLARYSRESCYSIHEKSDVVVQRQMLATHVNLRFTEGCLEPTNEVLEAALENLMEDVGRDRSENVEEREVLPERVINGLDVRLGT